MATSNAVWLGPRLEISVAGGYRIPQERQVSAGSEVEKSVLRSPGLVQGSSMALEQENLSVLRTLACLPRTYRFEASQVSK